MSENNNEVRTAVTPIKKSMIFQKEKQKKHGIGDKSQFKSYDIVFNGREVQLRYNDKTEEIIIEDKVFSTHTEEKDGFFIVNVEENHVYKIVHHDGKMYMEGRLIEFDFKRSIPKLKQIKASKRGEVLIQAPLPGQIVSIAVKKGDSVKVGQKILTLEAMKMQNEITSPIDGKVLELYVAVSDSVGSDTKLALVGVSIE
ncbi:MAG: acetyl-CoA carboxylase biotin carboxyl carrier protein subunit [Candidatus Kariarchaeaceae archaeon]